MDTLLIKLAGSVSAAADLEDLTRPLLELLEAITGLESTYLTTIDEKRGMQHVLFARNSKQMQIPEGLSVPWEDTLCKRALQENRAYTDDVGSCWGDSGAARELGIQTYLSQPVRTADGGLYGTLCGASSAKVSVLPNTIQVLNLFAGLIGYQVERERQLSALRKSNQELSSTALTDPLTGVANRRALSLELTRVLARAQREQLSVQVAFIDLDGFKAINDHYGHEVGDCFLVHIAKRLAASVRVGDFVARYGGDEFVVITCNTSRDELRQRLERLTVGRYVRDGIVIDYTGASVGVAVSANDETNGEHLLARADAAMYASKKARRDQQTVY